MERLTTTDISMAINILCNPQSGDESDIRKAVADAIEAMRELQHYKDLEEQGRLVELPCKVGDTVWSTRWWDNKKISKKIDGETWYRDIFQHKITKEKFSLYDLDKIGKDVFLTKEEAEAKLKELKGGTGNEQGR